MQKAQEQILQKHKVLENQNIETDRTKFPFIVIGAGTG